MQAMDTIYIAKSKDTEADIEMSSMSDHDDDDVPQEEITSRETLLLPAPNGDVEKYFPDKYFERLRDPKQWDVQTALFEFRSLLSRPKTVYRTARYRFDTKRRYARDDPAFCMLQVLMLVVSSIGYCFAFRVGTHLTFVIWNVVCNWFVSGLVVAVTARTVANRLLKKPELMGNVELLYAFDIHCNAFVPILVCLYGIQFVTLPILLDDGFLALLSANTLYCVAFSWYWYICHLGYRNLPFLDHTEAFVLPIVVIIGVYLSTLIGFPFGWGFNLARFMARLYFV